MKRNETMINQMEDGGAAVFYDRVAHFYDLTFKFNRYGHSIERYLREISLPLSSGARILDAGCGTGLLTLSLMKVLKRGALVTAVDLSASSLLKARRAAHQTETKLKHRVEFSQANVLSLPFADETFEMVVTSGALEYVPLREGFRELARVLAPDGYLLHLPVRPSPISRLLELMFRFKTHPPREVAEHTERFFRVIDRHQFPPLHPIGWTKLAILAQKK